MMTFRFRVPPASAARARRRRLAALIASGTWFACAAGPAHARASGLTAWVEGLVNASLPGSAGADREVLAAAASASGARGRSDDAPAAEHALEAQWARTSDLGRRNGERFDQKTTTKLASDYGNGLSSEVEGALATSRGPRKGEDDDDLEAQVRLYYDVLNPGSSNQLALRQANARLEDAEARAALRADLEKDRRRVAEAVVQYVEKACLRRSLERAAARTRSLVAGAGTLASARLSAQKDLLAVQALHLEVESRVEKAVAEQFDVEPSVTAEGPAFARRLANAPFTDEAFCLPGREFEVARVTVTMGGWQGSGAGGGAAGSSDSMRVEENAGAAGADGSTAPVPDPEFELEAARRAVRREADAIALERWRAERRPSLKPFVGLGWEQEGGKDPRKVYVLGLKVDVRFGGYDESGGLELASRASHREGDLARARASARAASVPGLWRRRVRAFDASARRHAALEALRENLEVQWRAGLVETRDWTKAWIDALDAYEDLMGDWRDAASLRFQLASARPGAGGGGEDAAGRGPGASSEGDGGARNGIRPPAVPPRPGQPGYPLARPRR